MTIDLEKVNYNKEGLIPAVVQDALTSEVLMLAYMNETALKQTLKTKQATYFSRSRQKLWVKGESSGNVQAVVSIGLDCDQDTILLKVNQTGVACHKGTYSCFDNVTKTKEASILDELYEVITSRKNTDDKSYTKYLFTEGLDKILKKVGEETSEVIIASKNDDTDEMVLEISDLVYHLMVLMVEKNVSLSMIETELKKRRA